MRRSALTGVAAAFISLVVLCTPAFGASLGIKLHNETPYRLTLATLEGGGQSFCWNDNNLHHGLEDGWVADPGKTKDFLTYRSLAGG